MDETLPAASAGTLSLQFIGNATVLVRCAGFVVLTDPNFLHRGQRAYLGYGLTARRLTEPALAIEELPALDGVVLSHLHGDHWDRVTRRHLSRQIPVITTPHASRRLQGLHRFRRAVGLQTWEHHDLLKDGARLRVTSLPGQHAPGLAQHLLPPVMGSMLEFTAQGAEGASFRLYLSGDTLLFDGLHEISRRIAQPDLAVLHLGGTTLARGLMVTMDGAQGAELLALVRPHRAVPVHYQDYTVFASPLRDFTRAVAERGLDERVTYVEPGHTASFTAAGGNHQERQPRS
jgi:L-ascorbate metabolism protein UlaG (beta-lactamase superfamily)